MIDIRVKNTGVILDIAPDATFQVEWDNPMFADDRSPVPFSTEISLLPTQKNKEQLGYLAAMFLTPSVDELDVEIYGSGVKIMDGMLRFSSVKDGMLNYTFAGRSVDDDWSGKIWEKQIYQILQPQEQQIRQYRAIQLGDVGGVYAPLLINATETDMVAVYGNDEYGTILTNNGIDHCEVEIKYHNFQLAPLSVLTPAVSVYLILVNELRKVSIPDTDLKAQIRSIAILGQYKTDAWVTSSGLPYINVGQYLPDLTAMELMRIILKMFCCALFSDGAGFSLFNLGSIIEDTTNILDWDDIVSQDAEISVQPAGGYTFGYANDTDETFDPNENHTEVNRHIDMYNQLVPSDETYAVFRHAPSLSVLSSRATPQIGGNLPIPKLLLCDILYQEFDSVELKPTDTDGTVYDSTINAKLVRCIPDTIFSDEQESWKKANWRMAAIINSEPVGNERGTDVIVGKIEGGQYEKQLTDGSCHFENDVEVQSSEGGSLRPGDMFQTYHATFAQWCQARHQIVNAGLNLAMADIASFAMWKKIAFAGRIWFVRKLTLTFNASSGRIDTSGEFVSVD